MTDTITESQSLRPWHNITLSEGFASFKLKKVPDTYPRDLLGGAGNIVELNVIEDMEWHIADDPVIEWTG